MRIGKADYFRRRMVVLLGFALILVCVPTPSAQEEQDSKIVYSEDLGAQIATIGAEVEKQLSKKEEIPPQVAVKSTQDFVTSLRDILSAPLTKQQFEDIIGSVSEDSVLMGYDLYRPDPTALEIEFSRLWWTDLVKQYLQRKPLSESEQELIKAQIEHLLQTAQSLAMEHGDELQQRLTPDAIDHARFLINRSTNDPIMATFKRPMAQEEMDKLIAWLQKEIPLVMAMKDTAPDFAPDEHRGKLSMAVPLLWGHVVYTFNQRPHLSPEDMKRMREERRELIRERIIRERQQSLQRDRERNEESIRQQAQE